MEHGWACYHGDGFLEHLSFSASGFMDFTVNASSKTTLPSTPLHFCCHVIGPGEKDDHRSLNHAWCRFGDSRISKNSCPATKVLVF